MENSLTYIFIQTYIREKDIHFIVKDDNMEQEKGRNKEIYRNMKYDKK
jgi:hypothetical protein